MIASCKLQHQVKISSSTTLQILLLILTADHGICRDGEAQWQLQLSDMASEEQCQQVLDCSQQLSDKISQDQLPKFEKLQVIFAT